MTCMVACLLFCTLNVFSTFTVTGNINIAIRVVLPLSTEPSARGHLSFHFSLPFYKGHAAL